MAGGPAERPVPVRGSIGCSSRCEASPIGCRGSWKGRPSEPSRPPLTLDDMERAGFLLLGESPGHEIVFGTVVQPWKAVTDDEPAPQVNAGRFAVETREQVAQRVHGRPVRGVEELAGMLRAHPEVGSERLHRAAASASLDEAGAGQADPGGDPPHSYIPAGPVEAAPYEGYCPPEMRQEAFAAVLEGVELGAYDTPDRDLADRLG